MVQLYFIPQEIFQNELISLGAAVQFQNIFSSEDGFGSSGGEQGFVMVFAPLDKSEYKWEGTPDQPKGVPSNQM